PPRGAAGTGGSDAEETAAGPPPAAAAPPGGPPAPQDPPRHPSWTDPGHPAKGGGRTAPLGGRPRTGNRRGQPPCGQVPNPPPPRRLRPRRREGGASTPPPARADGGRETPAPTTAQADARAASASAGPSPQPRWWQVGTRTPLQRRKPSYLTPDEPVAAARDHPWGNSPRSQGGA